LQKLAIGLKGALIVAARLVGARIGERAALEFR
jgi:hypothetical protein